VVLSFNKDVFIVPAKKNKFCNEEPVCECPSCSANCYLLNLELGCEKCSHVYGMDNSKIKVKLSEDNINEIKKEIILQQKRDLFLRSSMNNIDEDELHSFNVIYKDQMLNTLKSIKREYKFTNLLFVIKFITEGFLFILHEMKKMSGNKIYLVDSNGNRSLEIKKTILGNAYKAFNEEVNRTTVERYLESINILFKIEDIKKDKLNNKER
jgi:predicted nucleic acid-binding Zn finger protein